ncbi:hypothetical protein CPB83DRAFT_903307 [Crepidotus variabilis]|uniref:Uncharacterized protein n=1 Tax=Crepidotus variabilis TaxID=179855 RepID=A0A9P6JUB4_9AGAR|nr:hypothetical protein CPB83DRAFT_903307 [Crepidotus variabilis]
MLSWRSAAGLVLSQPKPKTTYPEVVRGLNRLRPRPLSFSKGHDRRYSSSSGLFLNGHIPLREISANKVLQGRDNALTGMQGVLLDFDSAVKFTQRHEERIDDEKTTYRMVICVFQSPIALVIAISKALIIGGFPLHVHIDVLVSFFWLLFTLCHRTNDGDSPWDLWQIQNVPAVTYHKSFILQDVISTADFNLGWPLNNFHRKLEALSQPGSPPTAEMIFAEAPKDYEKVLTLFEKALANEEEACEHSLAGQDLEMDDDSG